MSRVWVAIVAAGAGTFAMRASFLAAAHRLAQVPPGVQRVLRQIPPAALAAITVPAVLRHDGQLDLLAGRVLAAAVAAAVAWRSKSSAATLVAGFAVLVTLQAA